MLHSVGILHTGGVRGGGVAIGSIGEVSVPGGTGDGVTDMPPPPRGVIGVAAPDLVVTVTWRLTPTTGEGRV